MYAGVPYPQAGNLLYTNNNLFKCYWSGLEGNGTVTWRDAELTANGVQQGLTASKIWKSDATGGGIPLPESFYTSPMARCLATANLTFGSNSRWAAEPFSPTVKEVRIRSSLEHLKINAESLNYLDD
jgi:bisphosphoglycerate-dependent phosphoglycerate mutase